MRASELRALNVTEIQHKLDTSYQELFNLRFQWASGQLADHNRMIVIKHEIARMKTVLRERELAALAQGAAK